MKRITITMPDDLPFNLLDILDLVEPGASRHALMTERVGTSWRICHVRLGVKITETQGVTS